MVGDLILEVNGQDIRKMAYNDVAFLLKTLPQGKVSIKVGRFRTSASNSGAASVAQLSAAASGQGSNQTSRRSSITNQTLATTTATSTSTTTVLASDALVGEDVGVENVAADKNQNKLTTFKPCLKKM